MNVKWLFTIKNRLFSYIRIHSQHVENQVFNIIQIIKNGLLFYI